MCLKTGEPPSGKKTTALCRNWHMRRINRRQKDAKKINVPLMIAEFGACFNSISCKNEIEAVLNSCESTICSGWAYWQFKQYKDHTSSAN